MRDNLNHTHYGTGMTKSETPLTREQKIAILKDRFAGVAQTRDADAAPTNTIDPKPAHDEARPRRR